MKTEQEYLEQLIHHHVEIRNILVNLSKQFNLVSKEGQQKCDKLLNYATHYAEFETLKRGEGLKLFKIIKNTMRERREHKNITELYGLLKSMDVIQNFYGERTKELMTLHSERKKRKFQYSKQFLDLLKGENEDNSNQNQEE